MAKIFDSIANVGRAAAALMTAPRYLPGGSRLNQSAYQAPQLEKATQELAYATQVPFGSDGRAMFVDGDPGRALRDGFTSSHYVYLCVNLLAREMARPDWFLESRSGGTGKERQWNAIPDSDFEELMKRPNPFTPGVNMFERAFQHFFLTGNLLLLKVRGMRGKVRELWVIPPDQIKPVPSRRVYLSHYEYRAPGDGVINIDPDDVVHVMLENPANPFWGISPLQAMGRLIDTEVDALNWWRWSIRNRAAKDGFIKYKRLLTPREYDKIKRRLYEQVVGPWNARMPMILTGDADWVSTSQTAVEMDWIETRKMTREEICMVFGPDPILVGIGDKSTYNNKKEARLSLWQDRLIGEMDKLKANLDLQLLPDFVKPAELRRVRTQVDLSRIPALLEHLAELAEPVARYWEMGWTANELNIRFGLGFKPLPPEIGDKSWITNTVGLAEKAIEPEPDPFELAEHQANLARLASGGDEESDDDKLHALAGEPPRKKPLALGPGKDEPKKPADKPSPKREGDTGTQPASKGVYRET